MEIAQVIRSLPRTEIQELREWIDDYLEDQLEVSEDFVASIERGKKDISEAEVRVVEPKQG